jgi:hypothetical protein
LKNGVSKGFEVLLMRQVPLACFRMERCGNSAGFTVVDGGCKYHITLGKNVDALCHTSAK